MPLETTFSCTTKAGEALIVAGRNNRWRLYLNGELAGGYSSGQAAVDALAAGTVKLPPGTTPAQWKAPGTIEQWSTTIR